MSRRKVVFEKDRFYHVYNRGSNKRNIFSSHENYLFFLRRVQKYKTEFSISVIAYCLMPNHFHFLLKQKDDSSISIFMQRLCNSYTKALNKQLKKTGTLFEGPFKAIQIKDESHLIHLCRYIHRNPIDCSQPLVHNLFKWSYSNFLECTGARNGMLYDDEFYKMYFENKEDYKTFVLEIDHVEAIERHIVKYKFD